MATLLEADPFIRALSLQELERKPFAIYGNGNLRLIISGVGKANAAMASAYLVQSFHPARMCNLGAAGATNNQCRLGDCYHVTSIIEPDRPHLKTGDPVMHTPQSLKGFSTAILATQDRAVIDPAERARVATLQARLVDMEGASVVQACSCFGIPCCVFKFVSDTSDHVQPGDAERNILLCRDSFCRFFCNSVLPLLQREVLSP